MKKKKERVFSSARALTWYIPDKPNYMQLFPLVFFVFIALLWIHTVRVHVDSNRLDGMNSLKKFFFSFSSLYVLSNDKHLIKCFFVCVCVWRIRCEGDRKRRAKTKNNQQFCDQGENVQHLTRFEVSENEIRMWVKGSYI